MTGTKGGIEPTGIEAPSVGVWSINWKVKRSGALAVLAVPSNSGMTMAAGLLKIGNEKRAGSPSGVPASSEVSSLSSESMSPEGSGVAFSSESLSSKGVPARGSLITTDLRTGSETGALPSDEVSRLLISVISLKKASTSGL